MLAPMETTIVKLSSSAVQMELAVVSERKLSLHRRRSLLRSTTDSRVDV